MAYEMQQWRDGDAETPLSAARMLHIEQGIEGVELTPGPQGEQGETGEQGPPGNDGQDGEDGADATTPFVFSENPDHPLEEGQVLIVLEPEPKTAWFDDFTNGLDGWTERWVPSDWQIVDEETAADGKALQLSGNSARRAMSLDPADSFADGEVVARVKQESSGGSNMQGGVVLRGAGNEGQEIGVAAVLTASEIRLIRFSAGAFFEFGRVDIEKVEGRWYWVRFRAEGENLMAKTWFDGEDEPAEWNITATDSIVPGPGWAGVATASGSHVNLWDNVGVSSTAEPAPMGAI